MNGFALFFKKEFSEIIKTVKGVVLAIIFLVVGISSPAITKLTPEILKMAGLDEDMGALMDIMPAPSSSESYAQFFSNFNTLGLLAAIIVFAGIVANEKAKNTAAYILTKNISRAQFILSKFASSAVWIFISLVISAATQIIYTNILFADNMIKLENVIIFFALLFMYLIFILSFVLFSSVLSKTVTSATFIAFLIFIGVNILAAIPKIGKYMPPAINNFGIITGAQSISGLTANIIITVLCSAAFVIFSVVLFNRQEL